MSFKDNLLKKITIDRFARQVINSLKPLDNTPGVDRESMKRLLEFSPYQYRRERDLDLHIKSDVSESGKILVLDNELAIYNTTVEDVALRKSPTIKEMINIRNAIKILNDSDVVVSKKEDSIKTIQKECIQTLDLYFESSDIETIEKNGVEAFEGNNPEGVLECLSLFTELLDYTSAPKSIQVANHYMAGSLTKKDDGQIIWGPLIIYNSTYNIIKFMGEPLDISDEPQKEYLNRVIVGKEKATTEGVAVFICLRDAVTELRL